MLRKSLIVIVTLAVSFPFMGSVQASAASHEMMDMGEAGMTMHHQHMLLDHGLSMVLKGSNLVMLGQMKMADSLDPMTMDHGRDMIQNGKGLINEALSGSAMMKMHKAGHGPKDSAMMKATHDLGESMLKMVDIVEKMDMGGMAGHMMEMHHMHVLINHAMGMALEGSNLAMVGQMKMAGDLDAPTVKHGKMMISDARAMIGQVMDSQAMKGMHGKGMTPDKDPMMESTHKLVEVSYKIIDQLEKIHGWK